MQRLRAIKQSLTSDATRILVYAFVGSRLDSCNSLLAGVSSQLLQRLQVVLSQEPEDQSIRRLFYAIFTGCRSNSGSHLRQQFWSTSVCTAWLHSTFRWIASRHQQSPAGVFDPLSPADWLFHAPEQTTATAASLSKELGRGTVFLLNCVHQTSRWRRSETDLRHSCSIYNCYPGHLQLFPILRYINILTTTNNNIIIIIIVPHQINIEIIWSWYTGRWWVGCYVQRGGNWAGPQPAKAPPRCTKCNSPPINGQCTNHRIAVWWSVALRF